MNVLPWACVSLYGFFIQSWFSQINAQDETFCPEVRVSLYFTKCVPCDETKPAFCDSPEDGLLSENVMCFPEEGIDEGDSDVTFKHHCRQHCERPILYGSFSAKSCNFTENHQCTKDQCHRSVQCSSYGLADVEDIKSASCDCRKDIMADTMECFLHEVCSIKYGGCDTDTTDCINQGFGVRKCECKPGFKPQTQGNKLDKLDTRCGYEDFVLKRFIKSHSHTLYSSQKWMSFLVTFCFILLSQTFSFT